MFARVASSFRYAARPQCLRAATPKVPTRQISLRNPYRNIQRPLRPKRSWNKNQTMVIVGILFAGTGIGLAAWGYYSYLEFLKKTMHNFPAPVASELRKALYYKLYNKPQDALPHFRAALEKYAELGMDPLSDEVTGIKLELAGVLEKYGRVDKTIEVLEHVIDELVAGAKAYPNGVDRTRLLKRGVSVGLKLGDLYMQLGKAAEAEEALVWAVETMLKEGRRREKDGVKVEEEGDWLSDEETGMALENLATYYESNDQYFLAAPLYLQAINLIPTNNCHAVVLMNNLSVSLAQQPIPPNAPITRHQLISDSATKWAQKALEISESIPPPERTEECDTGCVVAMYNLGEFAEMLDEIGLARQRFTEARSLAKGLGMKEGVERAEEGLKRLEEK